LKTLLSKLGPKGVRESKKFKLLCFTTVLIVLCVIAYFWRVINMGNRIEYEKLVTLSLLLREDPLGFFYVMAAYIIAGLVVFPVAILIPATALIFGPVVGPVYSLLGLLASASVLYALGHTLGHKTVHKLVGSRVNKVSQRLARHSLLTIVTLRLQPLAPFTVINLLSGASHIRFREYTLGTLIGMSPAIVVMTLLGNRLDKAIRSPAPENLLILTVLALVLVLAAIWLRRRFGETCSKE